MADDLKIDYSLLSGVKGLDPVTGAYRGAAAPAIPTNPMDIGELTRRMDAERARAAAATEESRQKMAETVRSIGGQEAQTADLERWYLENYPHATVAPPTYKPVTMQDVQANVFPLMLMATVGGLGSRRHAMGAISAFGSMLKGAQEGRVEAFQAAQSQYEASMNELQQVQGEYDRKFKLIMNDQGKSLTQRQNELKVLEMEFGKNLAHEDRLFQTYSQMIDRFYAEQEAARRAQAAADDRKIRMALYATALKDRGAKASDTEIDRMKAHYDTVTKPLKTSIDQLDSAINMLQSSDLSPQALPIVRDAIMQAVRGARSTQPQIAASTTAGGFHEQAIDAVERFIAGDITAETKGKIMNSLNTIKKVESGHLASVHDTTKREAARRRLEPGAQDFIVGDAPDTTMPSFDTSGDPLSILNGALGTPP